MRLVTCPLWAQTIIFEFGLFSKIHFTFFAILSSRNIDPELAFSANSRHWINMVAF